MKLSTFRISTVSLAAFILLVACTASARDGAITPQDSEKQFSVLTTSALRLAPADVSFFHTSLKLKERVLALWNTKAVQAAWKTKLVQSLWSELNSQFLENAGPLAELLQAKENQELMQLLLDMASDECFLMGGESLNEFMLLAGEVFTASQFSRIL
ncbi:MAG TPA: hypothetical protein PKD72_05540, partial [Gemmatales bacterium]|nr:hypothetical protein [Gemmatales bacterium]